MEVHPLSLDFEMQPHTPSSSILGRENGLAHVERPGPNGMGVHPLSMDFWKCNRIPLALRY